MTTSILIFFGIAFALVFALRLARIGTLLAFLLAGVISGPYGLGLFQLTDIWNFLGEVGIMFLWFTIGLEINMKRLWQMKRNIFGFGAAQVLMVAVMLFPILFGLTSWSIMGTVMVALIFAMSSTAGDLQILADRNELQTNLGRQSFSILLFQDLLAIPLLAMLPVFAGKSFNLGASVVDVLVLSVGLILGVVVVGRFVLNPLMRAVARIKSRELFLLTIMLNIIVWAVVLQLTGLPPELGAFLAGMLLSETIYRHQIKAEISPYATLFIAFFFIALGMGLDLNMLARNWMVVAGGVVALVAIKFAAIYIVARVRHIRSRDAFLIALILAQGGEFGLLILQTMKSSGINAIPFVHGEILIAIIVLSIMVTPLLLAVFDVLQKSGKLFPNAKTKKENSKLLPDAQPQVLICGFGRVGRIIAQMLESQGIPYAAVDLNVDSVMMGRENGFKVYYGDTSNAAVLRDMGLAPRRTRAVVLALDNAWVAKSTVRAVKTIAPRVKIFARARNMAESKVLMAEGVKGAFPETIESSFRLGYDLLANIGVSEDEIAGLVRDLRANHYARLDKTN
ncbi:MAG: cation:proton antiporter [Rickettsiales bacterium]|jgi:Kef-type K+ transport system membrane component KefB/voltage-gated potassium channel Kch|nr:cation:proton antiporter [Rickettsiales bacterium]